MLALYGAERDSEAKKLISLFESQEVVENTLLEVVKDHFNIDDVSLFNWLCGAEKFEFIRDEWVEC